MGYYIFSEKFDQQISDFNFSCIIFGSRGENWNLECVICIIRFWLHLREVLPLKRMFTFRHCPNIFTNFNIVEIVYIVNIVNIVDIVNIVNIGNIVNTGNIANIANIINCVNIVKIFNIFNIFNFGNIVNIFKIVNISNIIFLPSSSRLLKFLLNSNFLTSLQNKYLKISFAQKILSIFTAVFVGTFLKCVSRDRITSTFVDKIKVENYVSHNNRESSKGDLSRESHFSYQWRKLQRWFKSRITFFRLVEKVAKGI